MFNDLLDVFVKIFGLLVGNFCRRKPGHNTRRAIRHFRITDKTLEAVKFRQLRGASQRQVGVDDVAAIRLAAFAIGGKYFGAGFYVRGRGGILTMRLPPCF